MQDTLDLINGGSGSACHPENSGMVQEAARDLRNQLPRQIRGPETPVMIEVLGTLLLGCPCAQYVISVFRWKTRCQVTLPTEASEKARGAGYLRRVAWEDFCRDACHWREAAQKRFMVLLGLGKFHTRSESCLVTQCKPARQNC